MIIITPGQDLQQEQLQQSSSQQLYAPLKELKFG